MKDPDSGVERAKIKVFRESGEEEFDVMFNPGDYVIDKQNTYEYKEVLGQDSPVAQYVSGKAPTLNLSLFFDTYSSDKQQKEDVRKYTSKIMNLTKVDGALHRPPMCQFSWGSFTFKGVVEKVTQTFSMFLKTGIPVRATLKVTMSEVSGVSKKEQPLESPDRTKQRMLSQNDQLWMLASHEYDDPGKWREIAKANNIHNPRRLETGKNIKVPALE